MPARADVLDEHDGEPANRALEVVHLFARLRVHPNDVGVKLAFVLDALLLDERAEFRHVNPFGK